MTNQDIKMCTYSKDVVWEETTPMLRQYLEIKKNYDDAILLYRMGDFYETFFEDAILISREIELTLTQRDGGKIGKVPLAGVPAKALNNYLVKLIEKGYKVAICEQEESGGKLFTRKVSRVVTAGTITDDVLLTNGANNYLLSLYKEKNKDIYGIAYTDITTGEFRFTQADLQQTLAELARINPAEILVPAIAQKKLLPFQIVPEMTIDLPEVITQNYNCTKLSYSSFDRAKGEAYFHKVFLSNPSAYTSQECDAAVIAVGVIMEYIIETQRDFVPVFNSLQWYNVDEFLSMDTNTRKNLELLVTNRAQSKVGSLFWAIKRTKTSMGERLLKKWITQPLIDINEIRQRHSFVEKLIEKSAARNRLVSLLSEVTDVERLITRVSNNSANARDVFGLKKSLQLMPEFYEVFYDYGLDCVDKEAFNNIDVFDLAGIIEKTIVDTPPLSVKEGGLIKNGVSDNLDHYKDLMVNGEAWLKKYEEEQKEKTGIKFLKVGFSRTFGYFIEVSNSNKDLVPANYVRRQTLTNGERFITEELKKFEDEALSASLKAVELEYKIFCELREYLKKFIDPIRKLAHEIAKLDVLVSFATVSIESNYVKPIMTTEVEFEIVNARHAAVEKLIPLGQYVANDLKLQANSEFSSSTQFMILTGPNMAGKSTYMRQNAILIILAQIGCFVPADYAKIGVVDKIFTRVGAVDDLTLGQSTFMVEMTETAFILNNATERSFILLDEIGRGTSTYDGVAIAWAVAEYLATKIKSRTIFATHYHELNVMATVYPQIKNYRITVAENDDKIEFLRKVVEGSASKSYGIHVAQMAGLPSAVVQSAQTLMCKLQKDYSKDLSKSKKTQETKVEVPQLTFNLTDL